MERISKNFLMSEFEISRTASAGGIDNTIPEHIKPAIKALVNSLLQPLCDISGWRDLISSGYRSPALNIAIGGVGSSQHCRGEAADNRFYIKSGRYVRYIPPADVLKCLISSRLAFDQAILYKNFIHLSYTTNKENRRQIIYDPTYK